MGILTRGKGSTGSAAGFNPTNAGAVTTPLFVNNLIRNADPTNGLSILLDATTIATLVGNDILAQKANTVPVSDVTASFLSRNYGTDVAATASIAFPATATAWS